MKLQQFGQNKLRILDYLLSSGRLSLDDIMNAMPNAFDTVRLFLFRDTCRSFFAISAIVQSNQAGPGQSSI